MSDQDWSEGYVTDINYTTGFYRELSPTHLSNVMLFNGMKGVNIEKPFTYCELGFGQGLSLNMMAAAHPHAQFYGNDFNPNHVAYARDLADDAKLDNIHVYDDSFGDFVNREDLPDFDFIALHGVYSWISDENRNNIVQFIRKKLKVGGIVYNSYNCLPGWARNMPLRQLMINLAARSEGNTIGRINSAIEKTQEFAKFKPAYFQSVEADDFIENIAKMNRNYLAHEYFNRDWTPQYFYEVADEFKEAKLAFATSANASDAIEKIMISEEIKKFILSFPDMIMQETIRDYLTNQQFRRDIFTRGHVSLSGLERINLMENTKFALQISPEDFKPTITIRGSNINLKEEIYNPIIESFAKKPQSLNDLLAANKDNQDININTIYQALQLLFGLSYIMPINEQVDSAPAKRMRDVVVKRNMLRESISVLPSSQIGNAVNISSTEQVLLKAMMDKNPNPAEFLVDHLFNSGRKLLRDGNALDSREDNITRANEILKEFENKNLSLIKKLKMV